MDSAKDHLRYGELRKSLLQQYLRLLHFVDFEQDLEQPFFLDALTEFLNEILVAASFESKHRISHFAVHEI